MKPDLRKRLLYFATLILDLIGVVVLSIALGTNYWVVSRPEKIVDDLTLEGARNVTGGDLETKFKGYINFGLFNGYKELDHGLGIRKVDIAFGCVPSEGLCGWVPNESINGVDPATSISERSDYINDILNSTVNSTTNTDSLGLFNFGLWLSTIIFVMLSIIFGLIASSFAILNISIKPVETINGPMGLYLWNITAGILSLTTFLVYLALFLTDYRHNVLSPDDELSHGSQWTSDGRAWLHYSFYMVVFGAFLYMLNVVLLSCCLPGPNGQWCSRFCCCPCCAARENVDVHGKGDRDMMY